MRERETPKSTYLIPDQGQGFQKECNSFFLTKQILFWIQWKWTSVNMECFPKATLSVLTDMEILTLCLLYMIYCKECYLSWRLALIEYIGFVIYFDVLLSWEEWWYIWLTQIQNPNTKIVLKSKSISKIDFFFIFLISKAKEWQYLL